ncbi:MAG: LLM class flavin-dependent oxidoreductase [Thermomicrobiales bacterium]|nr:LLM class flavin-dependent oxidoreductase [Thermomicrobiales bacterium]MCO5220423.1 LLM class flavin-dependent oxidoreductase [Thermomicrobiales bacterium]
MHVGVILLLGEDEAIGSPPPYEAIRTNAIAAEHIGLDSVWIYDHLLYHFEGKDPQGVWEGWTIASALAEATERVALGTLVLCTAFRNPAVTAKMAITLDEVSNHRLTLGIGAGWHPAEFEAFGLNFSHKVDQFEEATKIIGPLVHEGVVDFTGDYVSAPNCIMLPKPTRRIPLLIAGKQPRMMRLVAQHADAYNTCWWGDVSATETDRANLTAACEAIGRDVSEIEFTVGVVMRFDELLGPSEEPVDPQKMLAGTVEQIAEGLRAYRMAGVDHIIANIDPLNAEGIAALARARELALAD